MDRNVSKTYLCAWAYNKVSNQPAHSCSLIKVFVVRMNKILHHWLSKMRPVWFWSDCAYAQADLNLRSAHMSEGTFSHVEAQSFLVSQIMPIYYANTELTLEPEHSISYKIAFAPSEDSDQPALPQFVVRVFYVRLKTPWILGYQQTAKTLVRPGGCAHALLLEMVLQLSFGWIVYNRAIVYKRQTFPRDYHWPRVSSNPSNGYL